MVACGGFDVVVILRWWWVCCRFFLGFVVVDLARFVLDCGRFVGEGERER